MKIWITYLGLHIMQAVSHSELMLSAPIPYYHCSLNLPIHWKWLNTHLMWSRVPLTIWILGRHQWLPLISYYMPWQSKSSGTGQISMVKTSMWSCLVAFTLKWQLWRHWEIGEEVLAGFKHWYGASRYYISKNSWLIFTCNISCSY